MVFGDFLVIVAIIVGPILAVQIQKFIENKKTEKERKMQVFRTLMATRATPLSALYVESLNMIDVEFYDDKEVVDAWKQLLDNFANYPQDVKAPDYQVKLNSSTDKSKDLFSELLQKMAKSLKYEFDKVHLNRGAYIPKGHAETLIHQELIRKSLIGVLLGQIPIAVRMVNATANENENEKAKPEQA